jgi:hypothetical protein
MIPMSAPTTHATWNLVSKRANARPRAASGPSRCKRLSNASRADAAPTATARLDTQNATSPDKSVPMSTSDAVTSSDAASICSSRSARRSGGPTMFPMKPPTTAIVAATPSANRSFFSENAAKKARNPTDPRITAIALPARRMLGWCSSSRSRRASCGDCSIRTCGIFVARIPPTTNTTAANRSDHSGPKISCTRNAGPPPTVVAITLTNASRELALTSSLGSSTSAGTSALFATE